MCQIIFAYLLVLFELSQSKRSKYPLYRPIYERTPILFDFYNDYLKQHSYPDTMQSSRLIANEFSTQFDSYITQIYDQWDSYHNYQQLEKELMALSQLAMRAPFNQILRVYSEAKSIQSRPLFRIQLTNRETSNLRHKDSILLICGEHPREFIVMESCLDWIHFILTSYFSDPSSPNQQFVSAIVDNFDIHILPILNPDGKVKLESSNDYCWRWNGASVDLNRNFDWEFGGKGSTHKKGTEEWHGIAPFSEPEAAFVRDCVERFSYIAAIDIHSGTQQLFIPFVDSKSRKSHRKRSETPEEDRLVQYIQSESDDWYKNSGIAWKYNDYGADGTILDWLGGQTEIPYVVCAEIYGDPTVDNSIDCFVQFNPDNGEQFQDSLVKIRSLYTGIFKYFLYDQSFADRFSNKIVKSFDLLSHYLD